MYELSYRRGPLTRALVVENPAVELDELLVAQGMDVLRLDSIPAEDELIKIMVEHRTQVLFKRSKVAVTRRLIEACPDLLVIQLCCIGDDSVDKQACADHGIVVFNDPVSNGRSVVELVFGNLISYLVDSLKPILSAIEGYGERTTRNDMRYSVSILVSLDSKHWKSGG